MKNTQSQIDGHATGTGGGVPEIQPTDLVAGTKRKLTNIKARMMTGTLPKTVKEKRIRPRDNYMRKEYMPE